MAGFALAQGLWLKGLSEPQTELWSSSFLAEAEKNTRVDAEVLIKGEGGDGPDLVSLIRKPSNLVYGSVDIVKLDAEGCDIIDATSDAGSGLEKEAVARVFPEVDGS